MDRRAFIAMVGGSILAAPLAVEAQPAVKIPRIGVLVAGPPPGEHPCVLALRRGLSDLGYVEGQSYRLEIRWSEGRPEGIFPSFGGELVRLGVDMIVSVVSGGLLEAKSAIANVPVVMAVSAYPVELRLIASLSHPGGNTTGMATFTSEMFAKRVQLLVEALPGVSRVAVFRYPGAANNLIVRDLQRAALSLGLKLQVVQVERSEDFPAAFRAAIRGRAQAMITTQGPFFNQHLRQTAELALKHKLPSFSGEPTAADAGMLMTCGPSVPTSCHRAAYFVDRILKGAKPADLPVEQPTKFDLAINLKTAKTLGLTIPQTLLLRADQVIE